MNEDELVRAACEGDRKAREKLGRLLLDKVGRRFSKSHQDREEGRDLCQDTLADVWNKLPQLGPVDAQAFLRVVFGMARMSDKFARSRAARGIEHEAKLHLLPEPASPRSPTSKLTQCEIANRYLQELSTPVRDVVLWRSEGGELSEYAAERDLPEGTVRRRYHTGMKQLRERLARDGLTPSQCGL